MADERVNQKVYIDETHLNVLFLICMLYKQNEMGVEGGSEF